MTSHRCCLASANVAIASSPTPAVAVEMIETSAHASITPCDEVAMAETPISDLSAASLKTSGWIVEPTTHAHDTSAFVSYDMDLEMPAEDASEMAAALPASSLSASHMHAPPSSPVAVATSSTLASSSAISSSGSTPLPDAIHMRQVRTAWLDRIANVQSTTTSVSQPSLDTVQDEEPSPLATASPCSPRAASSSSSPCAATSSSSPCVTTSTSSLSATAVASSTSPPAAASSSSTCVLDTASSSPSASALSCVPASSATSSAVAVASLAPDERYCDKCNAVLKRKNFERHYSSHGEIKAYKCGFDCGYSTAQKSNMCKHVVRQHKQLFASATTSQKAFLQGMKIVICVCFLCIF